MNRWQTWRKPPTIAGTAADTISDTDSPPPVDTDTPPAVAAVTEATTDGSADIMTVDPENGPNDEPNSASQFSLEEPSIEESNEISHETTATTSSSSDTNDPPTTTEVAETVPDTTSSREKSSSTGRSVPRPHNTTFKTEDEEVNDTCEVAEDIRPEATAPEKEATLLETVTTSNTENNSESSSTTTPNPTEKEPVVTHAMEMTAETTSDAVTSTTEGASETTTTATTPVKEPEVANTTTDGNSTNLLCEEEITAPSSTSSPTSAVKQSETTTPQSSSRYGVSRKSSKPFESRKPYKSWYTMLERLTKYIQRYNTSNIDTSSEYADLKLWVKRQRRDYRYLEEGKPSNMYPLKVQKLREVGFDFRTLPEQEQDEEQGIYTAPPLPTTTTPTTSGDTPAATPGVRMAHPGIYMVNSYPNAHTPMPSLLATAAAASITNTDGSSLKDPPSSAEQQEKESAKENDSSASTTEEQDKANTKSVMYLPKGSQAAEAAATLQSSQVDDANKYHMSCPEQLFNQQGRVGIYNADARKDRIEKYHSGRKRRQDIYFDNNLSSSKKLKETASDVPKKASKRKSTDMGASSSADEENDEDMDETATTSGAKKPNITGEGTDAKAASEAEAATSLSELGLASAIATLPSPGTTPGYSFISPNQMTWHSTPPQAASTTTPRTTPRKSTGSLYNSKDDLSTLSREELIQRCNRLQSELTKVTDKFKKQKISWEAKNAQKAGYIKTLKKQRDRQNDPLKYSWFGSLSVEELSKLYYAAGLWKDESAGNEEGGDTTANSSVGAPSIVSVKIPTEKRDLVYRMICHPRTKPYAWDNKSLDASDVLSAEQLRIKCQELKLHHGLGAPRLNLVLRILQHEYETIDERFYLLKKMQSKEDEQALSNTDNDGKQVLRNALAGVTQEEAELGSNLDNFFQETFDNENGDDNNGNCNSNTTAASTENNKAQTKGESESSKFARPKSFDERIAELLIFKQEHGHVNVKYSHGNTSLAKWCVKMRRHRHNTDVVSREDDADSSFPLKRKYMLAPGQIERLEQIGFDFTYKPQAQKKTFEEYVELLLEFKQKHGHMEVSKYGEDNRLGNWCRDMRVAYKAYKAIEANPDDEALKKKMKTIKVKRITADHIRRLEEVGFRLQSKDRKPKANL